METIVIALLAVLAIWLGWKFLRIRHSIRTLKSWVQSDGKLQDAFLFKLDPSVEELALSVRNTVTEATLSAGSEGRQREFLEALLNEINDAIFILDQGGEIRFLNEAARQLFPWDSGYRETPFLNICRDHRIHDTLTLAEEIQAKVSDQIDLRIHDSDSKRIREVNLLVEAEPLQFPGNEGDSGAWILLRDITSEKETEQIRRDFLANASHELRTPLSIITGYLESMDNADVDLNQDLFRRAIRTMNKHGERINRIVDDMLTISKLENAQELLNRKPFDLRDSLNEMIDQLGPLIEENHARVKVKSSSRDEWIITGDRFYWDQIFFNLIENALKQNPEPGLNIKISFEEKNGRIVIRIEDDGIGIPSKDLPLIFKRFYRVQKHHSQNVIKGTGLGLSIVKRAVEAHYGTISVDSRPGVATAFTISLPDDTATAKSVKSSEESNH